MAVGLVDFPAGEADAEALALPFSSVVVALAVANLPALNMFCAKSMLDVESFWKSTYWNPAKANVQTTKTASNVFDSLLIRRILLFWSSL